MSGNLESDRSSSGNKMHPMDLAPQKITIVKSVSNSEVKMAHLMTGQPKTTGSSQILTHTSPASNLMRSGLAQIIPSNVAAQPQMILSGSPILQGSQIISQGTQLIGQNTQIISQSQSITPSGPIMSPGTQIISQGTQLPAQVSTNHSVLSGVQGSVASSLSGTQVLNVGGQLVSGNGNLMVNTSVRTLTPTVRVLPSLPHHNTRPILSNVNVSSSSNVLVSKSVGVTSHVPRGLAAGASLAVRPITPASVTQPTGTQGWGSGGRGGRGALAYGQRAAVPAPAQPSHSAISTLPTTTVLTSSGVISGAGRGPRVPVPSVVGPRPLPLLQRNYQPAKVVGVANVGVRGVVGNSAPTQLYYEVPRAALPHPQPQSQPHPHQPQPHQPHPLHPNKRALAPFLQQPQPQQPAPQPLQTLPAQMTVVTTVSASSDNRVGVSTVATQAILPRPSILRKREPDGACERVGAGGYGRAAGTGWEEMPAAGGGGAGGGGGGTGWEDVPVGGGAGWEDVPAGGGSGGAGGSTTVSAASSPAPDDEPEPRTDPDLSPRKKPRKQILTNEIRHCDMQGEDPPPTPPPVTINPPPKRPLLSSSYVCGWRSTALHFARPADVRRREPRARDILAIAGQPRVLSSADGWKVHHLTAQMDDLMSLESDVGEQLAGLLRALETASGRALSALQPHSHSLSELLKGNIQRSKIVCESIQEAREDILRVFTHRNFVSDILTRQADKRCFRKHRSQS